MTQLITVIDDAETDILSCAALLAENVKSADGHSQAMRRVATEFLQSNDVDRAAQFADAIRDTSVRDRLLCDIAEKCAELDDDEYAFQLAEAIDDVNFQAVAREKIAFRKAAMGELEKAREIVATLDHPSETLAEIASHEFKGDDAVKALETTSQIDFPPVKVRSFQTFGLQSHQAGDAAKCEEYLLKAVDACDEIEYAEEKIRALHSLATSFIHTERNDKAIEVLAKARDEAERLDNVHRDSLLAFISVDFLRAGSIELADRTLDLIGDKIQIAVTLIAYGQEFALKNEINDALGALDEAHAIVLSQSDREVRDSRERYDVLANIAVRYAQYGKIERAVAVANENPFDVSRNQALIEIAKVCASVEEASLKGVVEEIPAALEKTSALLSAATVHLAKGSEDKALELFEEANSIGENIEQISARCEAFGEIGLGMSLSGSQERAKELLHAALKIVPMIRDSAERVNALVNIGNIYKRIGIEPDEMDKQLLKQLIRETN